MKKLLAIMAIMGLFSGCVYTDPSPDRVLKITHSIYLDVRTVVTDPEVMPMFSPADLERLADLERRYLTAADVLREYPGDAEAIQQISWLATEILGILGEVTFVAKVRPYVAAIRISIQLLRNHL